MSLKKFGPRDIITNTMRTHPSCEFFIVEGNIYYNNIPHVSGAGHFPHTGSGISVPVSSGYVSLYEMNVDRLSGSALHGEQGGQRFIGGSSEANEKVTYDLTTTWVAPALYPGGPTTQYEYTSTSAGNLQGWWRLKGAQGNDDSDGSIGDATVSDGIEGAFPGRGSPPKVGYRQNRVAVFPETGGEGFNIGTADDWDDLIGAGGTKKMTFAMWVYKKLRIADDAKYPVADYAEALYPRIFQFGHQGPVADGRKQIWSWIGTGGRVSFIVGGWSTQYGDWYTTDSVIEDNTWHHVVITYDAGSTSNDPIIYIDGTSVGVTERTDCTPAGTWGGIDTDDCFIGARSSGDATDGSASPASGTDGRSLYGMMAQFSVWDSIVSSDEVSALYAASDGNGVYDVRGGFVSSEIVDNGLIYPYVTKDGTRVSLNTLYTGSSYEIDFEYGDVVSGSYPLSASITRELIGWYPKNDGGDTSFLQANGPYIADGSGGSRGAGELNTGAPCLRPSSDDTSDPTCAEITSSHLRKGSDSTEKCADRTPSAGGLDSFSDISCNSPKWPHYWALKNTYRNYEYLSPHFALTSSYGIKDHQLVNLISIPSIFYGSKIKPGTVSLKWYLTGTLIGELRDTKQNGELIQVTGNNPHIVQYGPAGTDAAPNDLGHVAGVVFYNEGFIALTGSWALNKAAGFSAGGSKAYSAGQITIRSGSGNTCYAPMWIDWGAGANDSCNKITTSNSGSVTGQTVFPVSSSNNFESASFGLSFKGTNEVQTLTMFTHAKRGEVNYSNNPTFMIHTQSVTSSIFTSSYSYVEDQNRQVVNFVSSSHPDYSASFERQVYISRVGLYDENKNLIGVATLSNPVRKEEGQDLTFKLKLDI